ncbi:MAG: Nif3-like dinuclear metal center hexameric protein [Chitinispirillaceae bacterium]|nr:Nif3-like dinuclear metal center hexameric protein [Chitinispirillaceae bacterium]
MATRKTSGTLPAVKRSHLCTFLDETLGVSSIADLSSNGLQVEGSETVHRIGCAVDACMATYRMAVRQKCDMLLVHHGIIWGGLASITGPVYRQIKYLADHSLNLYAAHLPLDLHPVLGNNARLADHLRLEKRKPFGWYKGTCIGFEGVRRSAISRDALVELLCRTLDTECTVLPFGTENIKHIAIVSGGAAGELPEAIAKKVDCFITGEPSHENYHAALEGNINVIYAGHYHTEKGGVQALGELIKKHFGIPTLFLDVPTPI